MTRRVAFVLGVAMLIASCGRLGVGTPGCEVVVREPSSAMVLTLQAVPTAKYGPCINELKLGWDEVSFDVESGRAGFAIGRTFEQFLTVSLTASCDVGDATPVPNDRNDVQRYESVESVEPDIVVTVIPVGDESRAYASELVADYATTEVNERRLVFDIDGDVDRPIGDRLRTALSASRFAWIVTEIDAAEGTLELRDAVAGSGHRGVTVREALDRMESLVPDVMYRGHWFFVFDGGCIVYEFNASGRVAATVAADAEEALGFYPFDQLRDVARAVGYRVDE